MEASTHNKKTLDKAGNKTNDKVDNVVMPNQEVDNMTDNKSDDKVDNVFMLTAEISANDSKRFFNAQVKWMLKLYAMYLLFLAYIFIILFFPVLSTVEKSDQGQVSGGQVSVTGGYAMITLSNITDTSANAVNLATVPVFGGLYSITVNNTDNANSNIFGPHNSVDDFFSAQSGPLLSSVNNSSKQNLTGCNTNKPTVALNVATAIIVDFAIKYSDFTAADGVSGALALYRVHNSQKSGGKAIALGFQALFDESNAHTFTAEEIIKGFAEAVAHGTKNCDTRKVTFSKTHVGSSVIATKHAVFGLAVSDVKVN